MLAAPMLLARPTRTRGHCDAGAAPRRAGAPRITQITGLALACALAPVPAALAAEPAPVAPAEPAEPAPALPPRGPSAAEPTTPAPRSLAGEPAASPNPPLLAAEPAGPAAPPAAAPPDPAPTTAPPRPSERRPRRRWALGVEGVALQIPPLRPRVATLDPRFLGASVTLGGVGAVGRVRVAPELALELAVRSGSLRYRSAGDLISQDLLLAELGALLFLARGDVGHFALDAGLGGLAHAIRYELADGRGGRQLAPAFTIRVGADLELLLGRVALTFSLRGYGVVTAAARTRASGSLFDGATDADRRAPLPRYQTYLLGSAGLLYRF